MSTTASTASAPSKSAVATHCATSNSPGPLSLPMVSYTSKVAISPAANNWTSTFADDPFTRWILHSATSPNLSHHQPLLKESFYLLASNHQLNGATFIDVDGAWACNGTYFPAGVHADSFSKLFLNPRLFIRQLAFLPRLGYDPFRRTLFEYPAILKKMKEGHLGKDRVKNARYFYIAMLGTMEEARGKGLASAFVRLVKEQARKAGEPVWLETSTDNAKRMYERCGFREVDMARLGVGDVNEDGWSTAKGREGEGTEPKGVRCWAMAWWPEWETDEGKGA